MTRRYGLKTFKGCVIAISHHEGFVDALCNERWKLEAGRVTSVDLKKKSSFKEMQQKLLAEI